MILLSFVFFTYKSYEIQYKKDLKEYIREKTDFYRQQFIGSYNEAFRKFDKQKALFKSVHKRARYLLEKVPDRNLNDLVKQLTLEYNLKSLSFHIYLIDKNFIIYKTTFQKDLGFNLSIIKEAKEFLEKTAVDKKVYIADFISTDALNMEYKLYSYSYLSLDNYLELGFIDKSIYNGSKVIVEENLNKVKLFNVTKMKKEYVYYPFFETNSISKNEFYKKIKRIPLGLKVNDNIINAYITKSQVLIYQKKFAIVSTPLFQKNMYQKIGIDNIILEIKIDISSKIAVLKRYKNIFYISVLMTLIFLTMMYIIVNKYFTYPIEKIVQSINQKRVVDDEMILSKNDELSIIAKEYNTLLNSLNKELLSNRTLLEENKRFIADTVHQIRTPLTNIMMNSEMIKRSDKTQKSANFIDQINASINMLTNSYEDLSYTISYDTIEYHPSLLCISEILTQRIAFFDTISDVNFKKIISDVESNIFFTINQIEIERLIDNNISNAIKYADVNAVISITLHKKSNGVFLMFETYGKEILHPQKIFEKNYREDESKRGLGLGLNMVKNICEKYAIEYKVTYSEGKNLFTYIFKDLSDV